MSLLDLLNHLLNFVAPEFGLGAGDFLLRHLCHVRIAEHLAGAGQVGLALLIACPAAGHGRHFRMLARDRAVLGHVGHDVLAREQEVQLRQALRLAFELMAKEVFQGRRIR